MTRLVRVMLILLLILIPLSMITIASLGETYSRALPVNVQPLHEWLTQQGPQVIERIRSGLAVQ